MQWFKKRITIKETNLLLKIDDKRYFKKAESVVYKLRHDLEGYIRTNPMFLLSYDPIDVEENVPEIVRLMATAGKIANVGPMASVAGAISELLVKNITAKNIIAENGGDICLRSEKDVVVGLYAGNSNISGEIGFKLKKEKIKRIYGVCTSSSTVGHSVSFGEADAVTVFAKSSAIADAAATAICNASKGNDIDEMINNALEKADEIEKVDGIFIVVKDKVGIKGKIPELIRTNKKITLGELFDVY
ncbi:ApbE family lipoprotein [Methanocaldococcus vulcanius M7]|uniref:UPF0280 protein Metvu_1711 n=1 Tax=Methanocaldococcus vulcanius (strain ATCC 700851 / DSM 12094 / M7) TaxID=579137 RepID=C9RE34_METVM|nr:UPF0280 family protein [Methanocaldococcus vulcanius]ACX73563.1 ApbE family lipoprotein [Methanocaldococcus vulcanius M7]